MLQRRDADGRLLFVASADCGEKPREGVDRWEGLPPMLEIHQWRDDADHPGLQAVFATVDHEDARIFIQMDAPYIGETILTRRGVLPVATDPAAGHNGGPAQCEFPNWRGHCASDTT